MKVYLAGPMTGYPAFNFPVFDAAAADLRARGYNVVSPAELDSPQHRAAALASEDGDPSTYNSATGDTWGELLARDVRIIADQGVQALVVLPGWEKSRGARLETFVGRLCGLPIYEYVEGERFLGGVWVDDVDVAHGTEAGDVPICSNNLPDPEPPLLAFEYPNVLRAHVSQCSPKEFMAEVLGETRVVNPVTGGEKGAKPQKMSLLPWDVLMRDVAPLYARGAEKYERDNWRRGYDWSLSFDALGRHLAQFHGGQWLDDETGCPHLASVVFHACALMLFHGSHPELNDICTLEG